MSADGDDAVGILRRARRLFLLVAAAFGAGMLAVTQLVPPAQQFRAFALVAAGTVVLVVGAVVFSVVR